MNAYETIGAIISATAALVGAYALSKSKETERRAATRDDVQQALTAQAALLDRYERRIVLLEEAAVKAAEKAEEALALAAQDATHRRDCERRLALAEARIAELEAA